MKQQRWEESEKRKTEKEEDQRRERKTKRDQGARKSRQIAKHRVFPYNVLRLGASKSRLAKDIKNLHSLVAQSKFESENATIIKIIAAPSHF